MYDHGSVSNKVEIRARPIYISREDHDARRGSEGHCPRRFAGPFRYRVPEESSDRVTEVPGRQFFRVAALEAATCTAYSSVSRA